MTEINPISHIIQSKNFEKEFIQSVIPFLHTIKNENQDYLFSIITDDDQDLEIQIGKYPISTLFEPVLGFRIKVEFNNLCYRFYLPENDFTLDFDTYDKNHNKSFVSRKIPQYLKERIEKVVKNLKNLII
jgi:hypothetical protein